MRLHRTIANLAQVVALCLIAFVHCAVAEANTNRPASWAQKIEKPGLSNLHLVTTNLYRGAQPTAKGMIELKALGVKTVINLRSFHSDRDEVSSTGLKRVRFTTQPWDSDDKDVIAFLKVMADTNNLPAMIHCQRGADRTGLMCAMYRVVFCGWEKKEAIEEMRKGGFAFYPGWKNQIRYVEKADIEKLKLKSGIGGGTNAPVQKAKQN